jgi:AbrB family looped-hinge helix DNA binding protein
MAETSVVTSKGQLVIPARLRRRFGIRPGTVIAFHEHNDRIVLQPITPEFIRGLKGSLRRNSKAGDAKSIKSEQIT